MNETMLTYIYEEQRTNEKILQNFQTNAKAFIKVLNEGAKNRWVVLATGSSANAIECARYYVQDIAQITVDIEMPFVFSNYANRVDPHAQYFALTQSGKSYSTIEALKKVQQLSQNPVITMSANLDSPIIKESSHIVDLGCGEELVGYVTKGFSATVLTFMLMGLQQAKQTNVISELQYQEELKKIAELISQTQAVIDKTLTWYQNTKAYILGGERFVFIGYGAGYGVCKEAETKITETVRVPMNAHELEEYMHGPYIALTNKDYIFFVETKSLLEKRLNALKTYVSDYTEHTFKITYQQTSQNPLDLTLDIQCDEHMSALLMVIPIQMLSYFVAEDKGNQLAVKTFTDFDDKLKSKI